MKTYDRLTPAGKTACRRAAALVICAWLLGVGAIPLQAADQSRSIMVPPAPPQGPVQPEGKIAPRIEHAPRSLPVPVIEKLPSGGSTTPEGVAGTQGRSMTGTPGQQ